MNRTIAEMLVVALLTAVLVLAGYTLAFHPLGGDDPDQATIGGTAVPTGLECAEDTVIAFLRVG